VKISVDALALAPAAVPMVAALLVLLVDVVFHAKARLPWIIAALGLIGALGALVVAGRRGHVATLCSGGECWWRLDAPGTGLAGLALVSALVVVVLAALEPVRPTSPQRAAVRAMLVLSATAGCVGVVAARDLASWLVLLELATLPSIALVALRGGRAAAHGALTLLVTALASFAVLALGCALWFAATGTIAMSGDAVITAFADPARKPLAVVAMMLVLAGVGFKLSLAPFHAWTPEAFAGSGTWVAAFLATTSKVGALGAMLVVVSAASALGSPAQTALGIIAALSMTLGNVMALRQVDLLRLMAWSTVAQAGWVLLPLTSVSAGSTHAAAQYLALYTLGTAAVFVVLAAFERPGRAVQIDALRGMFRSHPLSAATMVLGLLALAGLPPSIVGVVAKVVAMKPVAVDHSWWLLGFAVLNTLLGVAVYLRWIVAMFVPIGDATGDASDAPAADSVEGAGATVVGTSAGAAASPLVVTTRGHRVVIALMALVLVATSILPSLLLRFF